MNTISFVCDTLWLKIRIKHVHTHIHHKQDLTKTSKGGKIK